MQTKTIGLLGGIGLASSAQYYRLFSTMTAERTGDIHCQGAIAYAFGQQASEVA